MFKVVENRGTELVAKRRAIEGALEYWSENEADYFAELEISYFPSVPEPKKIEEKIIARREVISHFLGVECLWYWRGKNGTLYLHREQYLELWELLKNNQKEIGNGKSKRTIKEIIKKFFRPKSK